MATDAGESSAPWRGRYRPVPPFARRSRWWAHVLHSDMVHSRLRNEGARGARSSRSGADVRATKIRSEIMAHEGAEDLGTELRESFARFGHRRFVFPVTGRTLTYAEML